jgi:tetratricopeptide (TPR) repeat protein
VDLGQAVSRLLCGVGAYLIARADLVRARSAFEHALSEAVLGFGPDQPGLVPALNGLGTALRRLGLASSAVGYHQQALTILEKTGEDQSPEAADALSGLGSAERRMSGDLALPGQHPEHPEGVLDTRLLQEARQYHERALAIHRACFDPDHPDVATDLAYLSEVFRLLKDLVQARDRHEQALAIRKKHFGDQHPMFAYSLNDLGGVLRDAGQLEKAIPLHEQALAIYREQYGEEHPFVGYTLRELGDASILKPATRICGLWRFMSGLTDITTRKPRWSWIA